jgi:threonine/homoserine/homoserine lactone efflux protein
MDQLATFAAVAALVILLPGPDLVLVTRSVLAGGRRSGLLTALGIATGSATWALAAAVGLAALLAAAPDVLSLVRWLGAGYLAWLGMRSLLGRAQGLSDTGAEPTSGEGRQRSWTAPYRIGIISNLLHPGQVVFYTSMLPQFIDPARDATGQALLLGAVFVALALGWFSLYALLAAMVPLARWSSVSPTLQRVTGVVLVGFALRLALRL